MGLDPGVRLEPAVGDAILAPPAVPLPPLSQRDRCQHPVEGAVAAGRLAMGLPAPVSLDGWEKKEAGMAAKTSILTRRLAMR